MCVVALAGCGRVAPLADDAAKYGDDMVRAIEDLLHTSADDATRYLDDAARAGKPVTEAAVVTWATHVSGIADALAQRWFTLPSERDVARSFVVSTACDAFAAQQASPIHLVTSTQLSAIAVQNVRSSRQPALVSDVEFVGDVIAEIQGALVDGDLVSAFPSVALLVTCQQLG